MRAFANANPRDMREAARVSQQAMRGGQKAAFAGGGSDLLGMIKEHLVTPDVLVHLKAIPGMDKVESANGGVTIGGLITLTALSRDPLIRAKYPVLAEAAESVAT